MQFKNDLSALVRAWPAALSIILWLAIWEFSVAIFAVSPLVLPAPTQVAAEIVGNWPLLWSHIVPTLKATLFGFACSLTTAFVISVLIDFAPALRRAILPLLVISQTLPLVAIAPLVVLWFGFGLLPKILLVALVTFFPMLVALIDGYDATEAEIEALLASMGAKRLTIFRLARLPSALPYFFAGLRISITYAVVAAIFAEYAGARAGLGIFILNAKNNFRPDLVLAGVFVSSALTLILFGFVTIAQKICLHWRVSGEK